mmetsp:Transcript_8311/g.14244  ORF Transcript_8311/g.14244 Transcript_8311/m.14244 type:complete len:109 (-) Transcript_8311:63-389(-)
MPHRAPDSLSRKLNPESEVMTVVESCDDRSSEVTVKLRPWFDAEEKILEGHTWRERPNFSLDLTSIEEFLVRILQELGKITGVVDCPAEVPDTRRQKENKLKLLALVC